MKSRGLGPRDPGLGEVRILQFDDKPECEVIVLLRGRQLVLRCPNYAGAVKWARVECKSYGIPGNFPDH